MIFQINLKTLKINQDNFSSTLPIYALKLMSALERNFGYNVYQFEFKFLPNIKAKLSAKLRSCQSSQSMSQHVLFNVSVQAGSQLGKTGDKFEWSRGRRS